jgi:putative ABC transport system ATP-binding protein
VDKSNSLSQSLAVCVNKVTKRFHQGGDAIVALKQVDFEARSNELLMIVGPSGCGKTTLLSVIAGTLQADEGKVDVFNTPLHQLTAAQTTEFRRQHIGFIFQQYHLIPTINCLENVSVPLLLNGWSKSDAEDQAVTLLTKVGLKGREKDLPKRLSGGQQQRIAIARALVHEPRLVICDEPTAALDAETGGKIMELMADIARVPNRCVIVVTHDSRIFKHADRVAKMDDGSVVSIEDNTH